MIASSTCTAHGHKERRGNVTFLTGSFIGRNAGDAHVVQREGGSVGAVVEQPLDSFLVLVDTFVSEVGAAGQDVEDLERKTEKQRQ